ncbi:hypothetical protein [Micromonospora humida]|uniref:hypothetical protein n=1 Tax=Micromonospora humida TaxID=2809018 RepID=UPI0034499B30
MTDNDLDRALEYGTTATWKPARPSDTPGQLTPEHGPVQPIDADRIPLRTAELSTAGLLAQAQAAAHALEVERDDLRIQLHRAESETRAMVRDRDAVIVERDQARATVATVEREHHESLAALSAVWAALNRGGYSHPTATAAELVEQAVTDRNNARDTAAFRAGVIELHIDDARAARTVIDAVRAWRDHHGTASDHAARLDDLQAALAAYDSGDPLEDDESVLVDNRGRIWRVGPGDTWRHPVDGVLSWQALEAFDAHPALLVWLDEQDAAHVCDPIECACELSPADAPQPTTGTWGEQQVIAGLRTGTAHATLQRGAANLIERLIRQRDEQVAPSPGSGPARVQGEPDPRHIARLDRTGWVWFPDGNGRWRGAGTCHLNVSAETLERLHGPTVEAIVVPAEPEPIRPADWEQRAIDAVEDALAAAWPDLAADPVHTEQLAIIAVRAIIDAGLVGPGGRCPRCGSTYPRTVGLGEDARCWTCATEDQTGLDEPDRATP